MKLTDLSACFIKYISPREWRIVNSLAEADGVMFQCPKCAEGKPVEEAGGRRFVRGVHSIVCWFRGHVPDDAMPKGRWNAAGTGLDNLSFVGPQACSVKIESHCNWHGHVSSGHAE